MAINLIEKYNLGQQAYDLKQSGKSNREIARILSESTVSSISYNSVKRYFDAHENIKEEIIQDIIERNDTLIATSIAQSIDIASYKLRLMVTLMGAYETKSKDPSVDGRELAAMAKELREEINDIEDSNIIQMNNTNTDSIRLANKEQMKNMSYDDLCTLESILVSTSTPNS